MRLKVFTRGQAFQRAQLAVDVAPQEDVVVPVSIAVPGNGGLAARVDRDRWLPVVGRMLRHLDRRRPPIPAPDHQRHVRVSRPARLVHQVHVAVRCRRHAGKRVRPRPACQRLSRRRTADCVLHFMEMNEAVSDRRRNGRDRPRPRRNQRHLVVVAGGGERHGLVPCFTVCRRTKPDRIHSVLERDPGHPYAAVRSDRHRRIVIVGQAFRHSLRGRRALDLNAPVEPLQGLLVAHFAGSEPGVSLRGLNRDRRLVAAVDIDDHSLPARRRKGRLVLRLHLQPAVPLIAALP